MVGPSNVQQFMDPYQQQVTQNVLAEIDRQGAMAQNQAAAQAVASGAFGGGREGVQRAELARNLQDIKSRRIAEDLQRNFLWLKLQASEILVNYWVLVVYSNSRIRCKEM
mgnify:CR=1 FL=1